MTPVKFTPDGRPVYPVAAHNHHHPNKETPMSSLDTIIKALESLPAEQKRMLAERLNVEVIAELSAADTAKAEKVRVAKIQAMRADRDPAFRLVEGALARAGIKVEEATSVAALDKLFANAFRPVSVEDRMTIKAGLHRLALLGA
jgi:hypothetical protein